MIRKTVKKMCRHIIAATAAISIAVGTAACTSSDTGDFSNIVEVADESDSNLPKATEIGSNTAGAYLNMRNDHLPWTMNYHSSVGYQSAEIRINNSSLTLTIPGHIKKPYQEIIQLKFTISNFSADSLTGLQALSNSSYQMSNGKLQATITPMQSTRITVKDAAINFSRCRLIYKNQTDLIGVSVAGKFTMQAESADNTSISVDKGRFDLLFKSHDGHGVFM